MKKLGGKIAVVTGGLIGIGASIAKWLEIEVATVIIKYNHSHKEAQAVVKEIEDIGSFGVAMQADISDSEPTRVFIETVLEK